MPFAGNSAVTGYIKKPDLMDLSHVNVPCHIPFIICDHDIIHIYIYLNNVKYIISILLISIDIHRYPSISINVMLKVSNQTSRSDSADATFLRAAG